MRYLYWLTQSIEPWMLYVIPFLVAGILVGVRLIRQPRGNGIPRGTSTALRTRITAAALSLFIAGPMALLMVTLDLPEEELDPVTAFIRDTDKPQVLLVDVSGSVETEDDAQVMSGIFGLFAEQGDEYNIGLIVFASKTLEMWDPDGEATLLEALRWLFTSKKETDRGLEPLDKPWKPAIGSGTELIPALEKALEVLERDEYEEASILLVSDLQVAALTRRNEGPLIDILTEIRESPYDLRIIALEPNARHLQVFEAVLGDKAVVLSVDKDLFLQFLIEQETTKNDPASQEIVVGNGAVPVVLVWIVAASMLATYVVFPRLPTWRARANWRGGKR